MALAAPIDLDSYTSDGEIDASRLQASVSRRQLRMYDSHFEPLENQLHDLATDRGYAGRQAADATAMAESAAAGRDGRVQRELSRYGQTLTDREQSVSARHAAYGGAQAVAGSANRARTDAIDLQRDVGQDLGQMGVSTSQQAAQDLSQAAQMHDTREREYQQAKDQWRSNRNSAVASGVAMGLMTGNPWIGLAAAGGGYLASTRE